MKAAPRALGWIAVVCFLCALAGCSKVVAPATTATVTQGASDAAAVAGSVCDRQVLKLEDVAGILNAPVTGTKPVPGDAQSCQFTTATFPAIIVSVRPGLGRTTVDAWAGGNMPLESGPLTGVGDAAVWLETLHEVIAQKNAVLCDIQVRGGGSDLALSDKALPQALGALCNKIFSAS
jgi:hypothetical protein